MWARSGNNPFRCCFRESRHHKTPFTSEILLECILLQGPYKCELLRTVQCRKSSVYSSEIPIHSCTIHSCKRIQIPSYTHLQLRLGLFYSNLLHICCTWLLNLPFNVNLWELSFFEVTIGPVWGMRFRGFHPFSIPADGSVKKTGPLIGVILLPLVDRDHKITQKHRKRVILTSQDVMIPGYCLFWICSHRSPSPMTSSFFDCCR